MFLILTKPVYMYKWGNVQQKVVNFELKLVSMYSTMDLQRNSMAINVKLPKRVILSKCNECDHILHQLVRTEKKNLKS